ncbi:RNA polymerase sporulation sigma factor SigK [Lederbergia lenta]|uniref:RNA polymerase sigma factor n=1 Tax=Lederbergia lenta TaxID=1467 RepID=A0A2X4YVP4_LEDLE|nr:RNA polymerase sporulation sigma factor SigK [Lederbergia lenta]MCM3111340.1 RNA polymerase sporulation sigma factor SigK [Lederbergia lenta]MEC2325273.1 RNA polymerase sporulation sigma factor SigK [Lederbergia lenta]SQI55865.1 RNA polymerase, sigma 28 subunit, SigK [Lederbergia lenta]
MSGILTAIGYLFKELVFLVSYVKNNAFPQPLSPEDEKKYLQQMAEGDDNARNLLIEHNLRLVAHIVKKFENTGEDSEDLISIGTIGLIKGIESYSFGKGTKLATYAARCIENEILMHLRALKKTKKDISLHDPIGQDKEGNEISLIDVLKSEAEDVFDTIQLNMELERVKEYVGVLDEREREVIVGRFGLSLEKERTQREIAKELGISRSYVSRIEKRALMKMFHEFYRAEKEKMKKAQEEEEQ